jgi:O-acetyl-ADP-ribose deacetylase (regulator of RNase III)
MVFVGDIVWLSQAAPIALQVVKQYLEQHTEITLVRFVVWDAAALNTYERAASRGAPP